LGDCFAGGADGVQRVGLAATAGLPLCWLRLCSRSLLAPALLHAAASGPAYTLAFLVLRAARG
jgi:hypothetical protein